MKVIFYSTHCPKCRILETKLKQKNVEYIEIDDTDKIIAAGVTQIPSLDIDGTLYPYAAAVAKVNAM